MSLMELQKGLIYGPVHSRRLGLSLGINLLPTNYKLCSFDCIYCQYGRTELKALLVDERHFPYIDQVLLAIESALQSDLSFDYLTFSGNGEPTLHPEFVDVVQEVASLRNQYRPQVRLALLSNASTIHQPHIRQALKQIDLPILKLDAGDALTFARINRPSPMVRLENILDGLRQLPGVTLQSMLIDGAVSNVRGQPYEDWLEALRVVQPRHIQIYSTDRPAAVPGVQRVPPEQLKRIAGEIARRIGAVVDVYWQGGSACFAPTPGSPIAGVLVG